MLICSDQIIEEADFLAFQPAGPLLMRIGFIPFDKVITVAGPTQGLADTTVGCAAPVIAPRLSGNGISDICRVTPLEERLRRVFWQ